MRWPPGSRAANLRSTCSGGGTPTAARRRRRRFLARKSPETIGFPWFVHGFSTVFMDFGPFSTIFELFFQVLPASFDGIETYEVDDQELHRACSSIYHRLDGPQVVYECRARKNSEELRLLRYVNRVSSDAHMAMMRQARPGLMECGGPKMWSDFLRILKEFKGLADVYSKLYRIFHFNSGIQVEGIWC